MSFVFSFLRVDWSTIHSLALLTFDGVPVKGMSPGKASSLGPHAYIQAYTANSKSPPPLLLLYHYKCEAVFLSRVYCSIPRPIDNKYSSYIVGHRCSAQLTLYADLVADAKVF